MMTGKHSDIDVVNTVVKREVTHLIKLIQAQQKNSLECRLYIILCIDVAKPFQKWLPSYKNIVPFNAYVLFGIAFSRRKFALYKPWWLLTLYFILRFFFLLTVIRGIFSLYSSVWDASVLFFGFLRISFWRDFLRFRLFTTDCRDNTSMLVRPISSVYSFRWPFINRRFRRVYCVSYQRVTANFRTRL